MTHVLQLAIESMSPGRFPDEVANGEVGSHWPRVAGAVQTSNQERVWHQWSSGRIHRCHRCDPYSQLMHNRIELAGDCDGGSAAAPDAELPELPAPDAAAVAVAVAVAVRGRNRYEMLRSARNS